MKEYREGATAPFLASKWRVSVSAVRAQITRRKSTKRDWGDAQVIAQAQAREAELEEARRNSPEAVAARLFQGLPLPADDGTLEDGAEDPAALARMATVASGRAMRGRLWAEARALAALAETYQRLAAREGEGGLGGGGGPGRAGAGVTPETAPLSLIAGILEMDGAALGERFAVDPDTGEAQPDYALKRAYWQRRAGQNRWLEAVHFRRQALERRVEALEAALVAADLPLPEEHAARRAARLAPD